MTTATPAPTPAFEQSKSWSDGLPSGQPLNSVGEGDLTFGQKPSDDAVDDIFGGASGKDIDLSKDDDEIDTDKKESSSDTPSVKESDLSFGSSSSDSISDIESKLKDKKSKLEDDIKKAQAELDKIDEAMKKVDDLKEQESKVISTLKDLL